ncbi:FtsX-like permease family protein [Sphingomonas sp. PP-CC-3A-396]|uniref:FtsX-like permease family protein n=1 Tax=Sphingomonas sp. PP-CC-3A-396 TaxID=2135655 RepID=UPI001053BC05|nr:FtsX-like permease family protein [Sphingomonas sp. PP-CC-3A-396]TCQ06525.1 putative ABC transport system permease protein [Sphingomonas sp. PP-CC-3A-396]
MNHIVWLGFYRSLTRHKMFASLNIGGLAIGIAVFVVLGLYVRFETSYENWLPHHDQIYVIETVLEDDPNYGAGLSTPVALWSAISRDLPAIVGTRLDTPTATVIQDGIGINENLARVDPKFFSVMDLPAVKGDLRTALASPSDIVVTQRTAIKYFGAASALGKTMTLAFGGEEHLYRVSAVIADLPRNTELDFDLIVPLTVTNDSANPAYAADHNWNYGSLRTFVRLPDADAMRRFSGDLTGVVARHARSETPGGDLSAIDFKLQRLTGMHFEAPGSELTVTTLGIVGLLTLLIAIVNYVNLATARAGLRAREVAMRKVLGADSATLARHYVGEAIATTAIAAFIGLILAECSVPLINAAAGLTLHIEYLGWNGVLLPMVVLVLVVGNVAGIYPALVLSRFPAAAVLASARSPGGGRTGTRIREALVVLQFTIAIAFVVGTLVLVAQTRHVRSADPGYDRQDILIVPSLASSSLDTAQRATLLHRFASAPGVSGVAVGNSVPGGGLLVTAANFKVPGNSGPGPQLQSFQTTPGYFRLLEAKLVAGRVFDAARPGDAKATSATGEMPPGSTPVNVVLNRSAVAALRYASPQAAIGKTFGGDNPKTVIGVVKDMRFGSARSAVPPTLYEFQLRDPVMGFAMLRFTGDPQVTTDVVRRIWRETAPQVPFRARTAVQSLDRFYARDDRAARLFTIGAVLAVAIGCIGLWGLASFNTARRVKEIGIRKTLGASSTDIVRLLVGQFLRPVLIANLFAWPLAFFAMRTWLAGFDDRIALSPLYFGAASMLAVTIAVFTVLTQSLRASRAAPAWALRHD